MGSPELKTGISYFGNRNPVHFRKDLEDIIEHHCNFIVHTFSENDQSFYKGTLTEMIRLSKERGLTVYLDPWGAGRVFGGEAGSDFALKNREACQVFSTGESAPAACLNNPLFRDFMATWIVNAREVGADFVFWDEPHFFIDWERKGRAEERWTCWCRHCRDKYDKIFGGNFPAGIDREMMRFREDSVIDFLAFLTDYAHGKGLKNALCLLPLKAQWYGLSDWSGAASLAGLDVIGTDPYWLWFDREVADFVGPLAEEVVSLAGKFGKEAQIWIQNFKVPEGREWEIGKAVEVSYRKGVRNFAAWSYLGTAYMSYIKSDNPGLVWEILGNTYRKLLEGAI